MHTYFYRKDQGTVGSLRKVQQRVYRPVEFDALLKCGGSMAIQGFVPGKLLRIFVDEADHVGLQPTYCAVVDLLRSRGVAGATVFRGIEGYGGHNVVHMARVFSWSQNMPILVEVVDDWEKIEPLLPELRALVGEGLLTVEAADYLRLTREPKRRGEEHAR